MGEFCLEHELALNGPEPVPEPGYEPEFSDAVLDPVP
jgi:hypothetical protein